MLGAAIVVAPINSKEKTMAKKPVKKEEVKEEPVMVMVTCICSNVHLGNGLVLRAEQTKQGNWIKGDSAEVPKALADKMIENGQCK